MGRQPLTRPYAEEVPRRSVLLSAGLLALVLLLVALTLRVPYVELVPGPVTNTLGKRSDGVSIITVKGHPSYPTAGQLDLTTVGVRGGPLGALTLAEAVVGWLNPHDAVLPQKLIYPAGQTEKAVEQQNTREMVDSQQTAITAALTALHVPVTTRVVVGQVVKGQPAEGMLRVGDVLTAVDGRPVTGADTLRTLIGGRTPGASVRLQLLRAGSRRTVSIPTVADPNSATQHALIGIGTSERHTYPFTVSINLKDVGGPSAGLMFTLGIIDTLTPGQLNGGRHIAGTGTIDDKGTVGPIGGIQQKVVAARHDGATIFLTPSDNCVAAKQNRPAGLTLVRVATLTQALDRLASIRASHVVATC